MLRQSSVKRRGRNKLSAGEILNRSLPSLNDGYHVVLHQSAASQDQPTVEVKAQIAGGANKSGSVMKLKLNTQAQPGKFLF